MASYNASETVVAVGTAVARSDGDGSTGRDAIILDDSGDEKPANENPQFTHMWYHCKPEGTRNMLMDNAHRATSLFFFKHNIPFMAIDSPFFRNMIKAAQNCPVYTPAGRFTLCNKQLDERNAEANKFKARLLESNLMFGFTITGDGYASLSKRQYHNHILVAGGTPIFLGLVDRTGLGASGQDVAAEFQEVMDQLDASVRANLIFGVTDTPSANRKAWRLLMDANPRMYWGGCMAHEISLYMGDVAKMECSKRLMDKCHKLYKWIMLHAVGDVSLLSLFREKVKAHFQAKADATACPRERHACRSRMTMALYKKGDTRMLSIFKLLFRTLYLMEPLVAVFTDARYPAMAQRAIRQYNSQATAEKKIKKRTGSGLFVDSMFDTFGSMEKGIWDEIEIWLQANIAVVYFHRIVDTHEPALHLVYYCSALNDKHLRVLADMDSDAIWLHNMLANFEKRWARWHLPIHTAAYHFAPQFQSHPPSRHEMKEIEAVLNRLWPEEVDVILVSLKLFKNNNLLTLGITEDDVKKGQTATAHAWYHQREHRLPAAFAKAGMQLCSQPASASVAEQGVCGWSKVGCIETAKRTRILTAKSDKLVNVNGWLWAQAKMKTAPKRPKNLDLYDTMDAMMEKTQEEARSCGRAEGESDAATDFELTDVGEDSEGEAYDVELSDNDAEDNSQEIAPLAKEGAYSVLDLEEDEYSDVDDEDANHTSPLPPATVVKVNDTLKGVLTAVPSLRKTNFESAIRKLAFG